MKIQLQQLDTPNKNQRVYPKEVMQKAIDEINSSGRPLFGTIGITDGPAIPLCDVAFTVNNLRVEDDYIVADAKILNTPKGEVLKEIVSSMSYRTAGVGNVENGVVQPGFVISYVSAIPSSDAA